MCALVFSYALLAASIVYGSPVTPGRIGAGRIVGGQVVTVQQYGFMASVGAVLPDGHRNHLCGATILTLNCILTAAQCVGLTQPAPLYRVRVGSAFFAFGGQLVDVTRSFVHPKFTRVSLDNDIALLKLVSHMQTGTTTAVSIATQGSVVTAGMAVTVLGWGYVQPNIPVLSDNLRAVNVVTVDRNVCRTRYATLLSVPDVTTNMICAGILDIGGSDFCTGDEGGPLVIGAVQVGIASWSYECGHPFLPGVYTNLPHYTDWILSVVASYFH